MALTDFVVAIELGSSKITGIAGKKQADGSIQVLAEVSEKASSCIRKGVIYNIDKTEQALASITKKLEQALKASISKVYVGIGGQSLRTVRNTEVRHLDEETKITQELIYDIMDSNREVPIIDQQILDVAPQEYKVGNNLLVDPVGVPATHIEGRFLNIIARSSVKQNIDQCFEQANMPIADYIIAPIAEADAVLNSNEKRLGCVLVDLGADTTTISIYRQNILRHLAVIPLGSNNITKDICSQQIMEEDAEELKLKYGCAYTEIENAENENVQYSIEGKCSIDANLLNEIIEARINEIFANVQNQISLSGQEDELLAGAILTGGGSNLKNIDVAFTKNTKIQKVRIAQTPQFAVNHGNIDIKKDGSQNTILALLAVGKENCYLPETPKSSPSITNAPDGLFDENGESAEAIRQKMIKEAEEKKRKEEEAKKDLADCETLIKQANSLKEAGKYKEALAELGKAKLFDVKSKEDQIKKVEQEIKSLKKGNSLFSRLGNKIGSIAETILKDED